MKFVHLSDLHLGKRLDEFSLIEDQRDILDKILTVIRAEKPDAVIIAGDVYDKSIPSAEAVQLFDQFLVSLAKAGPQIFVISGNHDSPERIAFASRLMTSSGVHLSPVYDGTIVPVSLDDAFGQVNIYLLPFIKPVHVRQSFPDEADKIATYTDAIRTVVSHMQLDPSKRNILVTHQFVAGATQSGSEDASVGGLNVVSADVFEPFDYVALGHIHGAQNVGSEKIRYCGTPLKYSFSEAQQEKSITVITLEEKGSLSQKIIPLQPLRDLRDLRGSYMELMAKKDGEERICTDYLRITLTDEEEIPNAIGKLRLRYPNLMKLLYDNTRTRSRAQISGAEGIEQKSPLELFRELYEKQNGQPMSDEQAVYTEKEMERILEENT